MRFTTCSEILLDFLGVTSEAGAFAFLSLTILNLRVFFFGKKYASSFYARKWEQEKCPAHDNRGGCRYSEKKFLPLLFPNFFCRKIKAVNQLFLPVILTRALPNT